MSPEHLKPDVLIIGSGPIGATYARILVEAGHKVVMVDAGPQMSAVPGHHLRNHRVYQQNWNNFADVVDGNLHRLSVPPQNSFQETLDRTAFWSRNKYAHDFHNPEQDPAKNLSYASAAYAVGGMSTLWTCAVPRQHPTMERSNLISLETWNKLYDQAEKFFRKHTDQFVHQRSESVKKALTAHYDGLPENRRLPAEYGVQDLPMAAVRRGTGTFGEKDGYVHWVGVDDILGPLLTDPQLAKRFTLLPEHLVTHLVHEQRDPAASGRITHVVAQDFASLTEKRISADVFVVATGAILGPQLLWNSGIRHEALGRYLNDQIVASCLVVLSKDIVHGFGRPPHDKGPINLPPNAAEPQVWIPVSKDRPWHCQIHQDPINFTTPGGELVDQRLLVFLQWFGMTEPLAHNRVYFLDKYRDAMGMPQPTFDYEVPPKAATEAHRMMDDLASASLSVGGWLPGQLPQFEPPGASLHLQSTTRMGARDDGTSVVDTHSRHWGFSNLYVGGCGVVPREGACNPTLTAAALAVRSAEHIASTKSTG